jgi:hypothetical protein
MATGATPAGAAGVATFRNLDAKVVAAEFLSVQLFDHSVGHGLAVHVGETEAAACARIPVVDRLEANPFAHPSEQSLELFGFKGLRQVADVEANAHGKKG